jgi:hypothetical protein
MLLGSTACWSHRSRGFGVQIKHIFHGCDVRGIDFANTPLLLQPWLELVFSSVRRIVSYEQAPARSNATTRSASNRKVQRCRPWRLGAGLGDEARLGFAIELGWLTGSRSLMEGIQTRFDQAFAHALNRGGADVKRGNDLLISGARMGFEQHPRPGEFARRSLSAPDQPLELLAFINAQIDHILFLWHRWFLLLQWLPRLYAPQRAGINFTVMD